MCVFESEDEPFGEFSQKSTALTLCQQWMCLFSAIPPRCVGGLARCASSKDPLASLPHKTVVWHLPLKVKLTSAMGCLAKKQVVLWTPHQLVLRFTWHANDYASPAHEPLAPWLESERGQTLVCFLPHALQVQVWICCYHGCVPQCQLIYLAYPCQSSRCAVIKSMPISHNSKQEHFRITRRIGSCLLAVNFTRK